MLLPILILFSCYMTTTIFAAPSTPNPRSFLEPLNKRYQIQCYHPPPNTYPPLASDCVHAARNVACGDHIETEYSFSRGIGWKVPYTWIWGSCSVVIDIIAPDNPIERASLEMISLQALQLISFCVMSNEYKSGGVTTVGANDLLNVVITGLRRPATMPTVDQCIATAKALFGP